MKLQRFAKTERLFHWAFAIPVVLLAASGILMIAASFGVLTLVSKETLRTFHSRVGLALIILPFLVYLQDDKKIIHQNIKDFLAFSVSDRRWLAMNFLSLIKSTITCPPVDKFNAGQKVNSLMMMALLIILCLSGLTMLVIKGALIANIFHAFAFSLFAMLFCGHLYLSLINPSTRPALTAIIHGHVDDHWLSHHHTLMFEKLQVTMIGDIVVGPATKKELKLIYERVYKSRLSASNFSHLCKQSEAMLVARRDQSPLAFMQIIGDGRLHGYISESSTFSEIDTPDNFLAKFTQAAEAVVGHPLASRNT